MNDSFIIKLQNVIPTVMSGGAGCEGGWLRSVHTCWPPPGLRWLVWVPGAGYHIVFQAPSPWSVLVGVS